MFCKLACHPQGKQNVQQLVMSHAPIYVPLSLCIDMEIRILHYVHIRAIEHAPGLCTTYALVCATVHLFAVCAGAMHRTTVVQKQETH